MFSNTCAMTLAQKSDRILAQTRGLSGATPNATQLIEELRWALEENRKEVERLRAERDEARREYCFAFAELTTEPTWEPPTHEQAAKLVANKRGWDCFKGDGT
jgi:hypothetical protein